MKIKNLYLGKELYNALVHNYIHMKTYTVDEAKKLTDQFIEQQAEILRQELRQAKRIGLSLSEHV